MKTWFRWAVIRWIMLGIVILFVAIQFLPANVLFSGSHLAVPEGDYEADLEGDYEVVTDTMLQVPKCFEPGA
jgi:hypothetical protein